MRGKASGEISQSAGNLSLRAYTSCVYSNMLQLQRDFSRVFVGSNSRGVIYCTIMWCHRLVSTLRSRQYSRKRSISILPAESEVTRVRNGKRQ